jgi:pyruvate-ferredoxin/flavodoxin oxidoreductase
MGKNMKTMDGNSAAAHIAYAFTDVAGIYPITPSSVWQNAWMNGLPTAGKNIFGQEVRVVAKMQSRQARRNRTRISCSRALTTTFTASQGLLLMIPNLYKIAGELLPGVFHVSARAWPAMPCLSSETTRRYGMSPDRRRTAAEGSVQEVMELAAVAHLSAIKGKVPFINFFDGFTGLS